MLTLRYNVHLQQVHQIIEFPDIATPKKIGSCLECFLIDFKLFVNELMTLPRLMGGNSFFSLLLAVAVVSPSQFVNTHLNAAD